MEKRDKAAKTDGEEIAIKLNKEKGCRREWKEEDLKRGAEKVINSVNTDET